MNSNIQTVLGFALLAASSFSTAAPPAGVASNSPQPGEYQIRNVKHDLLLRPEDAKKADGTPIVLYPATNWKCLVWKFDAPTDGAFRPMNLFTGKTFAARPQLQDSNTTAVVQVSMPQASSAQPAWKFSKQSGGYFQVSDKASGQALTAVTTKDDNVEIVLSTWTGGEEQKWELLPAPDHLDM